MIKTKHVVIAGGGIGGLTLAVALQRKGFRVTVFEQTPTVKSVGAGLALAANAIKAFADINLDHDVVASGKVLKKLVIKNQRGTSLAETDSEAISKKYGVVNNFTIHRADLQQVLLHHLLPGTVTFGKVCTDFHQSSSGVTLHFQDGSSIEADCVIACDGIHSVFRKNLVPDSKPRYAGYTCWRAVINNPPAGLQVDETSETWGPGKRFGIVPLSKNRVYWFACINAPANNQTMKNYKIADVAKAFADFHNPVGEIIKNTSDDQLIWGDIIDIAPLKNFAFENIVLMGDAAHATTPNMGQGACMAIEDAVILANAMNTQPSVETAFQKFESMRLSHTKKIVNGSWRLGRIAQLENPLLIWLRNAAVRATPARVTENQMKFLYEVELV